MLESITKILKSVLTAFYQPFWFAVILSVFFMFFLLYAKEHGWKKSIRIWRDKFKESSCFRRWFFLTFYTAMILFRTLLNRNMWMNPLSDIMGGWWIYDSEGELTTECIENVMLMIPFTVLLLWALKTRQTDSCVKLKNIVWQSVKITLIFSVSIEFLQLFLRLGTFQLSDIFYNTLGGFLGGVIYWAAYRLKHRKNRKRG